MISHLRYKVIACNVFRQEYAYLRTFLPTSNEYDVTWLELGLHRDPERLNGLIRDVITSVDRSDESFDAILLLYGLCSNSTIGLTSKQHRLVIARAHDCITLFLGSNERYREEFKENPGTYWFTRGFIDRIKHTGFSEEYDGVYSEYEEHYIRYLNQFGDPELALYVIENQEQAWIKNYTRGVLVKSKLTNDIQFSKMARSYCHHRGWAFKEMTGDLKLIYDLLAGEWDSDRYIIADKGEIIGAGNLDEVFTK